MMWKGLSFSLKIDDECQRKKKRSMLNALFKVDSISLNFWGKFEICSSIPWRCSLKNFLYNNFDIWQILLANNWIWLIFYKIEALEKKKKADKMHRRYSNPIWLIMPRQHSLSNAYAKSDSFECIFPKRSTFWVNRVIKIFE